MATFLMVESWLHSTGRALPPLLRDLGHRYVLATRDPALYPATPCGAPHPVVRDADEIVVVDTNDHDALAARAVDLAAHRPLDGVLTTCDYYLECVAVVAERLGLAGASPAVMATATRKDLVRAALDRAGLANPRWATAGSWKAAREAAAQLGYPLVAKPVDLNSGTAVRHVDDDAALKDAFHAATGGDRNTRGQPRHRVVLLEEVLTGPEVSVETVTHAGRTTVVGITDKSVTGAPAAVESGHMFPARLDAGTAADVEDLVRDALDALGLDHGLGHTEVRVTPAGPRVVEVNPRQGGGSIFELIALVTGTHPLEALVELARGRAPEVGTASAPRPGVSPTVASAAVVFVMSPVAGTVERVVGADRLDADPGVLRWAIPTPATAPPAVDNDAYLGHVLAVDASGDRARARAEAAVGGVRLCLADGEEVAPLGVPSGLAGPVASKAPAGPAGAGR